MRLIIIILGLFLISEALFSTTWKGTNSVKIAVLDFTLTMTNEGIDPKIITELFQSDLVNQDKFTIVERRQLEKVLSEKKLEFSGLTESEQAEKIGVLMGAQKIVTGSISKMGTKYILIVKGIDSATGAVDVSDQAMFSTIDKLLESTSALAARFTKKAMSEKVNDDEDSLLAASDAASTQEDSEFKTVSPVQKKMEIFNFSGANVFSYKLEHGEESFISMVTNRGNIVEGKNACSISFTVGPKRWAHAGLKFENRMDWTGMNTFKVWIYGTQTKESFFIQLVDKGDELYWYWVSDDWKGWKKITIPFDSFIFRTTYQAPSATLNHVIDFPLRELQFEMNGGDRSTSCGNLNLSFGNMEVTKE